VTNYAYVATSLDVFIADRDGGCSAGSGAHSRSSTWARKR